MHRLNNRFSATLLAAIAGLAFCANASRAGTMLLAVDSNLSNVSISLDVLNGVLSPTLGTVTLSGAAPAAPPVLPPGSPNTLGFLGDIQALANVPGLLTSYGGGASGTNLSFSTGTIPFVGSLTVGLNVPIFTLDTGPFAPTSSMPGMAFYDFGGVDFDVEAGQFSYAGTGLVLGLLGSGTIDFGLNLLSSDLAAGTMAKLTLGAGPPSNQAVTLEVPINSTADLLPGVLGLGFSGTLVFTGIRVPEPGTWALLVLGTVGLMPCLRRRRSS